MKAACFEFPHRGTAAERMMQAARFELLQPSTPATFVAETSGALSLPHAEGPAPRRLLESDASDLESDSTMVASEAHPDRCRRAAFAGAFALALFCLVLLGLVACSLIGTRRASGLSPREGLAVIGLNVLVGHSTQARPEEYLTAPAPLRPPPDFSMPPPPAPLAIPDRVEGASRNPMLRTRDILLSPPPLAAERLENLEGDTIVDYDFEWYDREEEFVGKVAPLLSSPVVAPPEKAQSPPPVGGAAPARAIEDVQSLRLAGVEADNV